MKTIFIILFSIPLSPDFASQLAREHLRRTEELIASVQAGEADDQQDTAADSVEEV